MSNCPSCNFTVGHSPDCPNKNAAHFSLNLSREMVSALAIHLFHRERPAYGWMEAPLTAIENELRPIHSKIHDENFNAMDTAFFGYDRRLP